ncbi:uncharacterized protein FA14DRAFT_162454 [Meira miltonrushii]|uniref:VASt domain-containing protein n=1 Tax=Meira miltonrushii TaxID=1280837 RepID=A0A316V412_9BASI|nr:uncharacterized protein FA14DRAFT_162454 [Meira miltonrushii]PWN32287.1 hypothetical protein FA14DRAFT_162454 [Meira miltonrushii]
MPSTLNNFFRSSASRRASFAAQQSDSSGASQKSSNDQSPESVTSYSTTPSSESESVLTPIATPNPAAKVQQQKQPEQFKEAIPHIVRPKNQSSLPPISTNIDEKSVRDPPTKSSSVPSIEIVSPSGNTPRHLWGPDDTDRNSNPSPSLSAISSENLYQSISPKSQSTALFSAPPQVSYDQGYDNDEEEFDDPLYSLSSSNRKMARQTKGDPSTPAKRGSKDVPDRHDVMRRAMADATTSDQYGISSAPAFGNERNFSNMQLPPQMPLSPTVRPHVPAEAPANKAVSNLNRAMPASQSTGSIVDLDKPGQGSLSFDHFAGQTGEGTMVLADGSTVSAAAATAGITKSDSIDSTKKISSRFPLRPKLGSRNNSYQSEHNPLNDSPTNSVFGHGTAPTPANTSSPMKNPTHGRYATTGHAAEPVKSKHSSLAVPGTGGALDAASNGRHHMHESASTGSLLASPLHKFRRLSDSNSKKNGPSGGIAGALAASGMAGMGVGHAELLQRTQSKLNEQERQQSQKHITRSRNSSIGSGYASGYEGGVYRDPVTGKMTERGPGHEAGPDGHHLALQSSNASFDGSDISAGSGLNAAANFALGLHDNFVSPEDPLARAEGDGHAPMTPGGIGAVTGLSPSGLGERVTLGEHDDWHHNDVDAQITGFAVASSKRNAEFHGLFPTVPEDDYLIEDYGCALVREILIQGRLYVSENHVCFYANIFGWVTNIALPFSEIVSVEKRMTAYVIPNAIQIATLHSKNTFASFLSRDTTYDLIVQIWKLSHPALRPAETIDAGTDEESIEGADGATISHGDVDNDKAKGDDHHPVKKSKRKMLKKKLGINKEGSEMQMANGRTNGGPAISRGVSPAPGSAKRAPHRKTTCSCERDKKHFTTIAMETTYPTVPEKLYNLIFTSGFMKDFWTDNQHLTDLQISPWKPNTQNNNNLSRDISYIKPLAGGFGPKQTKCLLTDENVHVDFDDHVIALTTTRTPDVPSGNSFSVKTKTCITWAGGNVSKMLVTCQVEWSGRSMLKSVIDRACIDGQKQYYKDLDGAIRTYIKEHTSEFREEGEDPEAAVAAIDEHAENAGGAGDEQATKSADGAAEGEKSSGGPLAAYLEPWRPVLDILSDAFGGLAELSPSVLILGGVVFLLVISNLWALSSRTGERDPLDPHRLRSSTTSKANKHQQTLHAPDVANSAEAVAVAVRDVLSEYFDHSRHQQGSVFGGRVPPRGSTTPKLGLDGVAIEDPHQELESLLGLLNDVEKRVSQLRTHINEIQQTNVKNEL